MTTPNNLDPLRNAIIRLSGECANLSQEGREWAIEDLHVAIEATLGISAEKGETDQNMIAARITDILRDYRNTAGD